MYLNMSKSTQSAAWLKALNPDATGSYASCAKHYPAIYILIYSTEVHLCFCSHMNKMHDKLESAGAWIRLPIIKEQGEQTGVLGETPDNQAEN